ncbi:exodeoxyribonuclease VII small subunit [Weissella tructae]|jgi:exodeoxyribonuclease VII small subunit|uniref:Exodeoxyribonuclease 7 small subunit n=2 Tax=Weissella TaxID=46255 RepID=A0A075U0Y0_9LACO|nr:MULTISPECIES: exodeoxyribonuclease VII small subunit [Weissella]AIG65843.1 Exodeoxyribonuclease 7 small subunit [Weissella tructae]AIM63222.1 Exodeoxyribonuclease 7 small subunit [Weissella ceti]AIM64557.1 Exodeoxyribonuclease 7 small subunit [Weissella ceti]ELA07214.1 exonuclease VII small subunit [Weissella ceti NC36]QVV91002.1 exodeoxyribonuclease VII small subunit [Weissella tructae]
MAEQKSFEENLASLEQIVMQLEKGDVPLEEALKQFEVGVQLSQSLQKTLETADKSLAKIIENDGTVAEFKVED